MFYTKSHEWIKIEGHEVCLFLQALNPNLFSTLSTFFLIFWQATVGISEFAQKGLCDVVSIELPNIGAKCEAGSKPFGTIECGNVCQ